MLSLEHSQFSIYYIIEMCKLKKKNRTTDDDDEQSEWAKQTASNKTAISINIGRLHIWHIHTCTASSIYKCTYSVCIWMCVHCTYPKNIHNERARYIKKYIDSVYFEVWSAICSPKVLVSWIYTVIRGQSPVTSKFSSGTIFLTHFPHFCHIHFR